VLFEQYGYRFVTVETHGVNAFFVDADSVHLADDVVALEFAENVIQLQRVRSGWTGQFELVAHLPYVELDR
jgi:hypothetical protein